MQRNKYYCMKNLVTIGGGSGQFVLLSGLRDVKNISIKAVVSMVDSGGSTGRLRDELGVLPPGDVLKCLLALSPSRDYARKILQKRFKSENRLNGHNAGNMLLSILSQYAGSFPDGIKALGEVLDICGEVLPVTTDKATLVAELTDGNRLYGESAIDVPRGNQREKIKKTFLVPHHADRIKVHPPVLKAIKQAQYIVVGPGDLFTSIIPNFLISEVKEEIKKTKAKIIYVVNIMTKFGETDNFVGEDFVYDLEKVMGRKVDFVIFNSKIFDKETLRQYKKQKAEPVRMHRDKKWNGRTVIKEDIASFSGGVVRHDEEKLSAIIEKIVF